jgi:hypothetical protein
MIRSVLALCLLMALCTSANAARVHRSNRYMSSFVPAKMWTHAFRRSSKTRLLATTIHPSVAADEERTKLARQALKPGDEGHRQTISRPWDTATKLAH